jgi:hypothetical protein
MVLTGVFFASLAGLVLLLLFKLYELNRGVKPLSATRYRLDSILRGKAEGVWHYIRYINFETFRLLGIFILEEIRRAAVKLLRKIEQTKVGETVRGRNIPVRNGNGTNSEYLKGVAEVKGDRKGEVE